MKKLISFPFVIFAFIYCSFSQNITSRIKDNKILIEFDINRYSKCNSSNISASWSKDGGKSYEKLCCSTGDIGNNISNGFNKSIYWDVMEYTNGKPFIESNVVFHIHQETCRGELVYYTDDIYSTPRSFNISNKSNTQDEPIVNNEPKNNLSSTMFKNIEENISKLNKLIINCPLKFEVQDIFFMIDKDGNKISFHIKDVGFAYQFDNERSIKNIVMLFCNNCLEFEKYEKVNDKIKYGIPEKWSLFRLEFNNKEDALSAERIFNNLKKNF